MYINLCYSHVISIVATFVNAECLSIYNLFIFQHFQITQHTFSTMSFILFSTFSQYIHYLTLYFNRRRVEAKILPKGLIFKCNEGNKNKSCNDGISNHISSLDQWSTLTILQSHSHSFLLFYFHWSAKQRYFANFMAALVNCWIKQRYLLHFLFHVSRNIKLMLEIQT